MAAYIVHTTNTPLSFTLAAINMRAEYSCLAHTLLAKIATDKLWYVP